LVSVNWFYKQEILKNITLENRLSLYSDYINKFGNIDIDYDLTLELVVNEYVKLIWDFILSMYEALRLRGLTENRLP
jgi:hypothetical protein